MHFYTVDIPSEKLEYNEGMNKKLTIFLSIVGVMFTAWVGVDNKIYFDFFAPEEAIAATGSGTSTLNVTVAPSITFTIDGTCDNDNTCDLNAAASFGTITAGTANDANVRVKSVSNDTVTLAVGRDRASPAHALASSADPSNIFVSDTAGGLDVFTGCGSPVSQLWSNGTSTGLGFSVWAATENKDTTCWGSGTTDSDANNKYAALQASSAASTAWISTSSGTKYASVGFTLDVTTVQRATTYTGDIVFTGTTTP